MFIYRYLVKGIFGGDEESRTPDPLLARQVLSQLSYTPTGVFVSLFVFSCSYRKALSGFLLEHFAFA